MIDFNTSKGAIFSDCGHFRYLLWRTWNPRLPKVLFIGLNPSVANESKDDATTRKVITFAKHWGFGGVVLGNCFPYISTDPGQLHNFKKMAENDRWLLQGKALAVLTIFAWGNFSMVREHHRDKAMKNLFSYAKVIAFNKNGSPKHPLYARLDSQIKPYYCHTADTLNA